MDGYPMRPSLLHSLSHSSSPNVSYAANGWMWAPAAAGLVKSLRRKGGGYIQLLINTLCFLSRPPAFPSGAGPFSMLSYVMCIPPGRKFRGREKKGGWKEGARGKLFETGKWRLLPTLTALTGHFPYCSS